MRDLKNYLFVVATICLTAFCSFTAFGQTVSEEARRHFDRGTAAVEMAKSPADYEVAIKEFKQAIDLAPEWADSYYNLARVQEQAEKFADAIASFRQYLRLAPNASDADEVKRLINKIEFKAEQVLSIPDIIDVLVDFSSAERWKNSGCDTSFLGYGREGSDTVRTLIAIRYYSGPTGVSETYQNLKVAGPVLKYVTTINVCDRTANRQEGGCDSVTAIEVEVVSKRLVKVGKRVVRGGSGAGVATRDRFTCTFQKIK